MEEVAPEYDVVVLGTGNTPPSHQKTRDTMADVVALQD